MLALDFFGGDKETVGDIGFEKFRADAVDGGPHPGRCN